MLLPDISDRIRLSRTVQRTYLVCLLTTPCSAKSRRVPPSQENISLVLVNPVTRSILYRIGGLRERSYEPQWGYSRFQVTRMIEGFFGGFEHKVQSQLGYEHKVKSQFHSEIQTFEMHN